MLAPFADVDFVVFEPPDVCEQSAEARNQFGANLHTGVPIKLAILRIPERFRNSYSGGLITSLPHQVTNLIWIGNAIKQGKQLHLTVECYCTAMSTLKQPVN